MFRSNKICRSPKKGPKTFLKRKNVYNPKESIIRGKTIKNRPVSALVDTKWKSPPGSENSNTLNKSMTSNGLPINV
jgi:hypothetical protein